MDHLQLFHNLVNLAAADNKFTEEELEFLAVRAENWGISNDELETAMVGVLMGHARIELPESREDRIELLSEMIRMMAADGVLADIEKRLCATASARMNFTTAEFERILDSVLAR
jgi:uncharacterized tellurite resistance protein B-like protein